MVTVSQTMKLSIKLDKQIDCNKLCQQIEKLLSKFDQSLGPIQDCILVLDVVRPFDNYGDNPIPKLEHKCIT
jgi:hypothetical protein